MIMAMMVMAGGQQQAKRQRRGQGDDVFQWFHFESSSRC